MWIAVIGSRDFCDWVFLDRVFTEHFQQGDKLVSGGALGADTLGKNWCEERNIDCLIFEAMWNVYGRRAGMIRNHNIIDKAGKVIAFWKNKSPGTKDALRLAKEKGIPCHIFEV